MYTYPNQNSVCCFRAGISDLDLYLYWAKYFLVLLCFVELYDVLLGLSNKIYYYLMVEPDCY